MKTDQKWVSYQTSNSYSTLNQITGETKNIWIVFHGIGYLSRYFLKYFEHLDSSENFIIAPQAPSKYYLDGQYKHVGASWATREHTLIDINNAINYLEEVLIQERILNSDNLILLGYSQGVSVLSRWMATKRIQCKKVIFHSGRIPQELQQEDFEYYNGQAIYVYGTEDPFLSQDFLSTETPRIKKIFKEKIQFRSFEGGHQINKDVISEISQE